MTTDTLIKPGHTLTIAEVGSNHAGDVGLALESIAAAKEAGADVVKFQMYKAEQLVDDQMPVLKYIEQSHATQRERFKSLQLTEDTFAQLAERTREAGLEFMTTPFYEGAVDFLDPLVPAFKIASGDMTNKRLIDACVATGKPLIMSTGLSTLEEVDWAVAQVPREQLHLLHCVGAYPTPDEQVNLGAIKFLSDRFDLPVGYSDHSRGITACVASVAMGAHIVEKHFLPDDNRKVADKDLSVGITQFREMVNEIRRVEKMLSGADKTLQEDEHYFCKTLRRSVYAAKDIPAGQPITSEMLTLLRPWSEEACSPMDVDDLVGKVLARDVRADRPILKSDIV